MKNANKVVKVVAKVLEIVHWVFAGFMLAIAICSNITTKLLGNMADTLAKQGEVSVYGFEVNVVNSAGELNTKALLMLAVGAVIIFLLVAMIFRNIYLIIKKSEKASYFNKDNVRMVREIGIFSIAVPVVGLIMSIITRLVMGVDVAEISVNLYGLVIGIVVLGLTQVFAYGAKLEEDVDGLL